MICGTHRIVLTRTPTVPDVDEIVAKAKATEGPIAVVVEHAVGGSFDYPTMDTVVHIMRRLYENADVIEERLVGTALCIGLDPVMTVLKDAALRLYAPRKPVCVSEDPRVIQDFLSKILE